MQRSSFQLAPGLETSPGRKNGHHRIAVNVVILYEDFACGLRARQFCEYLGRRLGSLCELTCQVWKFSLLGSDRLREMAAEDAADADIIIIAAQGDDQLPDGVETWIETWRQGDSEPVALVALFEQPAEADLLRAYLEEIAHKAQMDFFFQPGSWPDQQVNRLMAAPRPPRARFRL